MPIQNIKQKKTNFCQQNFSYLNQNFFIINKTYLAFFYSFQNNKNKKYLFIIISFHDFIYSLFNKEIIVYIL